MKSNENIVCVSVYLPKPDHQRLVEAAKADDRPVASYLRQLVRQNLSGDLATAS